ncbi:hypothetical protein BJV78DRAFT_755190 [Lactifluus subvellereus]|nr:hypothetical protein BJV78DRAFT_755190 [Lactifluus subvellereus]
MDKGWQILTYRHESRLHYIEPLMTIAPVVVSSCTCQSVVLLHSAVFRFICAGVPQEALPHRPPTVFPGDHLLHAVFFGRIHIYATDGTEKVCIRGLRSRVAPFVPPLDLDHAYNADDKLRVRDGIARHGRGNFSPHEITSTQVLASAQAGD